MAVNLLDAYEKGILPSAGGWLDQDQLHVDLIQLAGESKGRRQSINTQKAGRKAKRTRGWRR